MHMYYFLIFYIQIFNDSVIEVLHKQGSKFKQLFVIQFHTFFADSNMMRITKDQIDGVCKDIRYPEEFFMDLLFDEEKTTSVSIYEDDVAKWKNILSEFILKGFHKEVQEKNTLQTVENTNTNNDNVNIRKDSIEDKESDPLHNINTLNKADNIIKKLSKVDTKEEEDDDLDDYFDKLDKK